MGHYEGFNILEDGIEKFVSRIKEIWRIESSRTKGKPEGRYELTIGIGNRLAIFEPSVTTEKGVKTIFAWNLLTEDIGAIKKKANEINLVVSEVPFLWNEMPGIFPGQIPVENLPSKREEQK